MIIIILCKRLQLQVTILNINNMHTVTWFQVFLLNTNNFYKVIYIYQPLSTNKV